MVCRNEHCPMTRPCTAETRSTIDYPGQGGLAKHSQPAQRSTPRKEGAAERIPNLLHLPPHELGVPGAGQMQIHDLICTESVRQ